MRRPAFASAGGVRFCLVLSASFILASTSARSQLFSNQVPKVALFSPVNGSWYQAPAEMMLAAHAQDPDGYLGVQTVEFYANGQRIGITTNFPTLDPIGPFKLWWTNVAAGTYSLSAKATDEVGAIGVSDPILVIVAPQGVVPGGLKREVYTNVPGLSLSEFTNNAKFPDHPDLVGMVASFETPTQFGDNYGQRLTGFLRPPLSGEYRFYIASDDNGALFLSPDMNAGNKVRIAWESLWTFSRNWSADREGRVSPPITLERGKLYYVEALHKEGGGGDNFAIAWQLPGGDAPTLGSAPIAGEFLAGDISGFSNEAPRIEIVLPRDGAVFPYGSNIFISLLASDRDGGLRKVDLFDSGNWIGKATPKPEMNSADYVFTWVLPALGDHILTAMAEGSGGLVTTSTAVTVHVRTSEPGEREFHVVGVYSGNYNGSSSPNHEEGLASVTVNRPGKRVTLLLSGNEPVLWNIQASAETTIERVILGGNAEQRVQGLAFGVEVIRTGAEMYVGYSLESGRFYRAVPKLHAFTGMEISSFHGAYTASSSAPFVIDSVQDDVRLRSDYPQPTPLSELPNLSFWLHLFNNAREPGAARVFSQEYTLGGPVAGGELLPGMRVVGDGSERYFYAAHPHEVLCVDAQAGSVTEMQLGEGIPELSWPMGMTFDERHGRVLLVSRGGTGELYAYSPDSLVWSHVSTMGNLDLDCLVYHSPLDALYGLQIYRADYDGHPCLLRFDANGGLQQEIPLPTLPFDVGDLGHQSELVSVGDYLVLILAPDELFPTTELGESRIYLVDPRTQQVWLTYRSLYTQPETDFVTRSFNGYQVQLSAVPASGVKAYAIEEQVPLNWSVGQISDGGVFDVQNGKVKFGPFFDDSARVLTYNVTPPAGFTGVGEFHGIASADGTSTVIKGDCCLSAIYVHPGDIGADWSMKLDEVTAYAAAWRAGATWPTPPNPIPMEYVTRAGVLWRGGESYCVDTSMGQPPLCWVNCGSDSVKIPLARSAAVSESEVFHAVRSTAGAAAGGEPITVRVELTPGTSASTYAVQERLPKGCNLVSANQGGAYDGSQALIKWGPFFDSAPRRLEYQLVRGVGIAALHFEGSASCDGATTPVTGTSDVRWGMTLSCDRQPGGNWRLRWQGGETAAWVIESSADLFHWQPLQTLTEPSGELTLQNSGPGVGQQYYRARQLQPLESH